MSKRSPERAKDKVYTFILMTSKTETLKENVVRKVKASSKRRKSIKIKESILKKFLADSTICLMYRMSVEISVRNNGYETTAKS